MMMMMMMIIDPLRPWRTVSDRPTAYTVYYADRVSWTNRFFLFFIFFLKLFLFFVQ